MNAWLEKATKSEVSEMVNDLASMVRADELRLFLKKDKFSQVTDAVAAAASPIADHGSRSIVINTDKVCESYCNA